MLMIYELRVKKWMSTETTSLEKYYKNKENAEEVVKRLNELLDVYYVNEIRMEDENE